MVTQAGGDATMPEQGADTLRVIIVSDVRVVQEGLQALLAQHEHVDVVGTVDTRRALDQSVQLHPNMVLIDAARRDSVSFVKDLVAAAPHCRVVAFGVRESAEEQILALAAAGTAGYVRASADGNDVVSVLERVMRDELPCSPRTAASLYRQVATLARKGTGAISLGGCAERGVPLSQRELQIARLIDCGLTNKHIARRLGIETATVKNHLHNMYEKLKVHRRGEAAARIRALLGVRAPLGARASAADTLLLARPEPSPARGES
jgi:two-component system, NarL family, nitrate/nitrite response regulator NarL